MKNQIFKLSFFLFAGLLLFVSCTTNNRSNWLQFRGSGATGIAPDNATPPSNFGIDKNILWKLETPEGFSSPIIIDDNLILIGVSREEKKYLIWNIDHNDGSIKWQKEIAVDTVEQVHSASSPVSATPVSDGEYIYCYFQSFGLLSFGSATFDWTVN